MTPFYPLPCHIRIPEIGGMLSSPLIEVSECNLALKSFLQQIIITLASLSRKKAFLHRQPAADYNPHDTRRIYAEPSRQKSLPPVPRPLPVRNREIPVIPGPAPSVPSPDDHRSLTSEGKAQFLLSDSALNCYLPEGIYSAPKNVSNVLDFLIVLHVSH